jgi:ABC-type Fe3+ transport system permease subunit
LVFLIFSYSIIYTLLASFLTSTFGGTIGKLLTGIKVVRGDGQNLSFRRALFRNYIGYMVSGLLFGLGFLWMIFDKERRAWHDQIADTFVIVRNKWLVISGMAFFAIIVFVELVLINLSIVNFKSNSTIYTTIVGEIQANFQTGSVLQTK